MTEGVFSEPEQPIYFVTSYVRARRQRQVICPEGQASLASAAFGPVFLFFLLRALPPEYTDVRGRILDFNRNCLF